ncbi:MAG: hypothetical protein AB1571_01005 [Nanoarchaeota archaeon]
MALEKILKKLIVPATALTLTFSPLISFPFLNNVVYAQGNRDLAKQHFDKAKIYEKQGLYGNAMIELFKAKKYGEFEDIINLQIKKVAGELKRTPAEIRYSIKIMPFENNTNDTEIPGLVEESLNQYILKNKNLELKLAEAKTDITINGVVHAFNIEENERKEGKTVNYQEGTTKAVNPEYQRKLEDLQRKYGEYLTSKEQKKSSDTDAALTGLNAAISKDRNLGYMALGKWLIGGIFTGSEEDKAKFEEAKKDLENTPYYVDEPVHGWYNYDEITVTREGRLKLSLRLIDNNSNVIYNDIISKNANYKDMFRYENTYAGVYGDPLELPSKFEIKEQLIGKAISSASDSLDDAIELHYVDSLLERARGNKAYGNNKYATENYFKFLATADKTMSDYEKFVQEAVDYINSQAGTSLSPEILVRLLK